MSATNAFESGIMQLVFENTNYANIGDATGLRGSTTAGVFYISLHTGDPGEAGTQTTSESAYTNYARVSVARAAAQWTHASGVTDNDNAITFAACGVTGSTVTHFGIGTDSSGTGNLLFSGTSSLTVSNGVTPSFAAGALDITVD
jgi:hypothetical protein